MHCSCVMMLLQILGLQKYAVLGVSNLSRKIKFLRVARSVMLISISNALARSLNWTRLVAYVRYLQSLGRTLKIFNKKKQFLFVNWRFQGLKCVHQNIRNLLNKLDEIRYIINTLKSRIHLILFTETWLNSSVLDEEVSIPGYTIFRKDRGSKGGGVIVYVRDNLSVIRRSDLERPDVEGLWLEITLPKSRSFLFGTFIGLWAHQSTLISTSWMFFQIQSSHYL